MDKGKRGHAGIVFYKNDTFRFWSAEESRPHVHAIGPNGEVKFWLDPDGLHIAEVSGKINSSELNQLFREVKNHEKECRKKWREYFVD